MDKAIRKMEEKEQKVKHANEVAKVAASNNKLKKEIEEYRTKISFLEKANESLTNLINDEKKVKLPKLSKGKVKRGNHHYRIMIPDVHGNKMDLKAVGCMLDDLDMLGVGKGDIVIQIGDLVDCGGFLAQHQTMGYVAEIGDTSYAQDIASANWFIDELQKATIGADYHFLEGNHDQRIEKWCVNQSLRHKEDALELLSIMGVETRLSLGARGIPYYKTTEKHMGLEYPGLIKIGNCYYTHGSVYPTNAAKAYADLYNVNIGFGHTHRADTWVKRSLENGSITAFNPGTMSEKQPMWQHSKPTNWTHGYNLQVVSETGDFLNINVPIINGRSYLYPLLENR